ncbi:MAG: ATP-dependent DNA helicase [Burkholderiaceae bacterium]|jgi:ATP-dependent DNA helicase DinG|nr:ATP-dependent DNA helicase [Burkholderiaceae bacterium]
MTPFERAVQTAFGSGGPLGGATEGFGVRDGQTQLALAVARALEQGGALVAEAATGVGKTFAYLVPALLSGQRALLSTATKTLQDQLYGRDLPRLAQALNVPVRTALLKGRASYLCLHRLDSAGQSADSGRSSARRMLEKIGQWAGVTRTGDLAELTDLDERSSLIPLITSTRENCLGADCPQWRACHVNLARRQAMAADVVVINHHLFFADLAVRESGVAELLPTVRVAIFDEAHQLNETGIQFLGQQLATGQLLDFARDLLAAGLQHARGLADWMLLAGGVETAARDLRLAVSHGRASARLRWDGSAPEGVDPAQWPRSLQRLHDALSACAAPLDAVSEHAPDFARLAERAAALTARLQRFAEPCEPTLVRWADVGMGLRLVESPLDIAGKLVPPGVLTRHSSEGAYPVSGQTTGAAERPDAWPSDTDAKAGQEHCRAWVFVSATLGDDERLTWFTQPCGLQDAEVLRIGSPFDYARQAALYVPPHIVRPADTAHSAQVAQLAGDAAARLGGRTMVLTTTLRALRSIGDKLVERFGSDAGIEVLVQGSLPKRALMERFRHGGEGGAPGCVLVASASFWEGVDMPGQALQLLIIDKLPFPPPGDPLVEARCRRIESQGRSAFADYSVPEAAVALKQGAGRLIRRETDTGVLVICDTRLTQMSYGRRLLAALPPMRRLHTPTEFDIALAELARG